MNHQVRNKQPEPASNEIVWAFDLGKGPIGDTPSPRWGEGGHRPDEVNSISQFLHKAPLPCRAVAQRRLVIPAEFEKDKTGKVALAGFVLETLLNRCIRLADREPVCAI
jgi:hypothetical protein